MFFNERFDIITYPLTTIQTINGIFLITVTVAKWLKCLINPELCH